jgi:hypothetical protein
MLFLLLGAKSRKTFWVFLTSVIFAFKFRCFRRLRYRRRAGSIEQTRSSNNPIPAAIKGARTVQRLANSVSEKTAS